MKEGRSILRPEGWTRLGPGTSQCIEGRKNLSELHALGLGKMHAHQAVGNFEALESSPHPFRPRTFAGATSEN